MRAGYAASGRPSRAARQAPLSGAQAAPFKQLYLLRAGDVWRFTKSQPASFWLICFYLFLEYVRPHNIYQTISGWPLPSWTIVLCGIAYLAEGMKSRSLTRLDALIGVFSFIVLASSLTAYMPSHAISNLSIYFTWILIYLLVSSIVNTEERFLVFMLLYMFFCFKMSQHGTRGWIEAGFRFRSWGTTCAPAFFQNSGECGIQMAMFFPTVWFFIAGLIRYWGKVKRWFFLMMPATAAITIVMSSSRGAELALAVIGAWMILQTRHRVRTFLVIGVLAILIWAITPAEQKQRFSEMGTDTTSVTRLTYWRDGREIMQEHPVLGVGYANWIKYYPEHYPGNLGQLPHNIFIEAGAELGYTGLVVFIALIIGNLTLNHRTRRLARRLPNGVFLESMARGFDGALIAFLVGGFFVTVLYYPFFWINLAMSAALHNSVLQELKREESKVGLKTPVGLRPPIVRRA